MLEALAHQFWSCDHKDKVSFAVMAEKITVTTVNYYGEQAMLGVLAG